MSGLTLREPLGERRFAAQDFPIAIGGEGSTVVVSGRPAGPEAYIGVHEDQLFVQPAEGGELLHNGEPVRRSTWLRSGDVVNLGAARLRVIRADDDRLVELEDGAGGNITAPPVIAPGARLRGEGEGEDAERIDATRFRPSEATRGRRSFAIQPWRIAIGALIVVGAAILWFVTTAASVAVLAEPAGADLDFSGPMPAVKFGQRVLLHPGEYRIRAEHPGYEPTEVQAQITSESNRQIEVRLSRLPGRLRIETPAPAQVALDGEPVGEAPGEFEAPAGRRTVAITSDLYEPFSAEVEVEGLGKTQVFAPELTPNWAEMTVSSEPAGAQVFVDGEARGVTPLTTRVGAGAHPVELRLEGFKPWSTDVQVRPREPFSLGPVTLGLPDARLALRSEPSGAAVSVAGVYRGQTPLALELPPEISHRVVLTKPGYEAASRELTLGPGEARTLAVPLSGVFGEITVRAQPADAQVLVNGRPSGAANQKLRLVAAPHEIVIRKTGYVDYTTTVTPRPGVEQVVQTRLLTPQQARLAAIPATIRTKVGQQLKLLPTGRFTMGSPRREPGRRANEAQREVELKRLAYLGLNEVTNAQFRRFKSAHRSGIVGQHTLDLDNQPAVGVTWEEAALYCNWLSEQEGLTPVYERKGDELVAKNPIPNGYRLPTDAEWEWAARRDGQGGLRRYPWGDSLPVPPNSGNYAGASARLLVQNVIPNYDDGYAVSAPIGKFPPSPLGLLDIGGNVAEWVHDVYAVSHDSSAVPLDPSGPTNGKQHVIRGSSWKSSSVTDLRLAARDFGDTARNDVGFRVARYAEEAPPAAAEKAAQQQEGSS